MNRTGILEACDELSSDEQACCSPSGMPGAGAGSRSMGMCPMSGMCEGMMKQGAWNGWLLLLPGMFLVAGGLLVIFVPKVLAWSVGGAAIFMGVVFLLMAGRMRKLMAGMRRRITDAGRMERAAF